MATWFLFSPPPPPEMYVVGVWVMEILVPLVDLFPSRFFLTQHWSVSSIIRTISWLGTVDKNKTMYSWTSVNQSREINLWRCGSTYSDAAGTAFQVVNAIHEEFAVTFSSCRLEILMRFSRVVFFQSIEFTM